MLTLKSFWKRLSRSHRRSWISWRTVTAISLIWLFNLRSWGWSWGTMYELKQKEINTMSISLLTQLKVPKPNMIQSKAKLRDVLPEKIGTHFGSAIAQLKHTTGPSRSPFSTDKWATCWWTLLTWYRRSAKKTKTRSKTQSANTPTA